MARLKLIVLIALQIVVVKSYPFQDDVDVASRNLDDQEPNSMDADLTSLMKAVNRQTTDNAQQNLDALMNEVSNKDKSGQEQETFNIPQEEKQDYEGEDNDNSIGSLSEQNAEREGGEYKEEENLDSSHVTEGDIYKDKSTTKILDILQHGEGRDAITNAVRLWPRGKVPYVFGRVSSRVKSAFRQAIADYNKYTCIRVVPRRSERDYIYVVSAGGCWSSLSKSGGRQKLSLGRGCEHKGTAIHELMHALGFFHEQSRRDRDNYITINFGNITPGRASNFKKYAHGQADTLGEPYDYASIMHYPKRAFSRNGRDTIFQKRSGPRIGQRSGFSRIDLKQINKLYKCRGVVVPTRRPTKPGACKDNKSGCRIWATRYKFCVSGRYKAYMRKNCKKSCGLCKRTVNPRCRDKRTICPRWARAGYCKKYKSVKNLCPKSCKKC